MLRYGKLWMLVLLAAAFEAPAQPLPFRYAGSGAINGRPIVFLERDGRTFQAQANDVLDNLYKLERIERDRVLFRNLATGIVQTLPFGAEGQAPRTLPNAPKSGEPNDAEGGN